MTDRAERVAMVGEVERWDAKTGLGSLGSAS
jgi:hypothetical protein